MPFNPCLQKRESRPRGILPDCARQYPSTESSFTSSQGRFAAATGGGTVEEDGVVEILSDNFFDWYPTKTRSP
jgi:hypothetical protein